MTREQFRDITAVVIDRLEGGYYHPDMLRDGRVRDQRYVYSGETMYGIDRRAGGSLNTTPEGLQFWAMIDQANARSMWPWNYKGGALSEPLKVLASDLIFREYTRLSNLYLTPQARAAVDASPELVFHFSYATWNGPGWFQKFARDINAAVDQGKTGQALVQVAINSRTREGLQPGSPPNSLIAQGGAKIAAIFQEYAGAWSAFKSETLMIAALFASFSAFCFLCIFILYPF